MAEVLVVEFGPELVLGDSRTQVLADTGKARLGGRDGLKDERDLVSRTAT